MIGILRSLVALIMALAATLFIVPFALFFLGCFLSDRRTAERYMRGLAGGWDRSHKP